MPNPIDTHPNATVGSIGTLVGVGVVWLIKRCGVDLTIEEAGAVTGGTSTVLLAIGRDGIKGLAMSLWKGKKA